MQAHLRVPLIAASIFCGIVLTAMIAGCESEDDIADRVLAQRQLMKSIESHTIVAATKEGSRHIRLTIDDGRVIDITSTRHVMYFEVTDKPKAESSE